MTRTIALVAVAAAIGAAGCGIRPTGIVDAGAAPVAGGEADAVTVYLVREGKVRPVARPGLSGFQYLTVTQLSVRPTPQERAQGLRTEVHGPLHAWGVDETMVVSRPPGVPQGRAWSRRALAQIACTAEAVPGVDGVKLRGGPRPDRHGWSRLRCADFADLLA